MTVRSRAYASRDEPAPAEDPTTTDGPTATDGPRTTGHHDRTDRNKHRNEQ
ncbi:hypothetical protein [Streptomyces lydicus]|uniref:hypothetical protein n=1 Tax=Streptomyces lydicus TaxID=47763 RepID=UPI0037BB031D